MFNSKLDGIPGIGDERKKIIINHFGGIQDHGQPKHFKSNEADPNALENKV